MEQATLMTRQRQRPGAHPALGALAVFAVLVALYAWTMPRTVTLEDSGEFLLAARYNGLAHPPGYPLYCFLAHLAALLPVGNVAVNVHALSAVLAAGACALMSLLLLRLGCRGVAAWTAALLLGVSRTFWSQSIIAEVYGLNALFFFWLLIACVDYARSATPRGLGHVALVYGLFFSHHYPLAVLCAPGAAALLWPRRRELLAQWAAATAGFALGLLPLAWLLWRAQSDPFINYYGPFGGWEDVVFFMTRQGFAPLENSPDAGWSDRAQFARFMVDEFLLQWNAPCVALAAVGFGAAWLRGRLLALGLLLLFLCNSAALLFVTNMEYEFIRAAVFRVFPLLAYAVAAVWMGFALEELARLLSRWRAYALTGAALALGCGALVVAVADRHFSFNDRHADTWARDYAEAVLGNVEQDAIVVAYADMDTGPLAYLRYVEGFRPDVDVMNAQGLVLGNRIFFPRATRHSDARVQMWSQFIVSSARPVYYTTMLGQIWPARDFALYKRVYPGGETARHLYGVDRYLLMQFERILDARELTDPWSMQLRYMLIGKIAEVCAYYVEVRPDEELARRCSALLARVQQEPMGAMRYAQFMLQELPDSADKDLLWRLTAQALAGGDPLMSAKERATLLYLQGLIRSHQGRAAEAVELYQQSVELYPRVRNGAVLALLEHYAQTGDAAAFRALAKRVYGDRPPARVNELMQQHGLAAQ